MKTPGMFDTMSASDMVSLLYAIRAAVHTQLNWKSFQTQIQHGNIFARVIFEMDNFDEIIKKITLPATEALPYEQMKSYPRNSQTPVRLVVEPEYSGLKEIVELIYLRARKLQFNVTDADSVYEFA